MPVRPRQFVWAFPDGPPPERTAATPLRNAPAVDPTGRIFLHARGKLVALEPQQERPRIVWEYVTNSHVPGPVVVAPDGSLRLHCSDGLLHCVTSEGKQVYPPAGVGEPLGYAAPLADSQGNTWISAYDGGLIKVDARGKAGGRRNYFRSRQKLNAPGVVRQGVLYVGSEDGCLFAIRLDETKGESLWNHADREGCTGWYIHSAAAITDDGVLVVASCDECLYGFRPDGHRAWRTLMPGQLLGSPVIDRQGQLYVGVSQSKRGQPARGRLVCADGNSHKIRWEYEAAGPVESTPVIGDDDIVYFGDNAGVVHAVDFQGRPQWTAQLESPVRSAGVILAPQRAAFGLDNETLVVLSCSSGGLAGRGWPKIRRDLGQCGMA